MKTLLKNGTIITKDSSDRVIINGWILLNGCLIEDIGSYEGCINEKDPNIRVIDLKGNIMLPGLINSHTHFSQTLLKGCGENLLLDNWLEKFIRPFQENIDIDQMCLATELSIAENLRHGVTTVIQHHKLQNPVFVDVVTEMIERHGIRGGIMIGCNDKISSNYDNVDAFINSVLQKKSQYDSNKIVIGFGPTSLRNCSIELFSKVSKASFDMKMPIHIHIAETENERFQSLKKYGLPPVEAIKELGLLNKFTQLVHCIWVDDNELELIRDAGSSVICCPVNNMFLSSGYTNISKMLEMGIPVVLGTDGSASSNSQDILQNARLQSLLLKLEKADSAYSSASSALYMITKWPATMLGREDIGQLVIGAKADIIVVDTHNIRHQPVYDPQVAVVFNTSPNDISMVIVDGKVLLENGKLTCINEEKLIEGARNWSSKKTYMTTIHSA